MEKENTIKRLRDILNELSTTMYIIYVDWYSNRDLIPLKESEKMAANMYRMMIFKAMSIFQMSKGIVIIPTQESIIPDPSTMYPVLRSMYELLFLFRCMFVLSKNDKERELLLNLWKIKGNHNLTQIPDGMFDDESINKKVSASEENENIESKMTGLMTELNLTPYIINKIYDLISLERPKLKGFTFKHCEHSDTITDFCMKNFSDGNMGTDLSGTPYIYSHYSAHSHPSYLGVKHFEEMYFNKEEDKYIQEVLVHACKYLDRFMKEFCDYNDSYRSFYNKKESRINNLLSRI